MMASTMQAWQYTTIDGTIEKSLTLNLSAPAPDKASLAKDQLLVEVISAAINPIDHKLPESGWIGRMRIQGRPATPGLDFCGRVIAKHPSNTSVAEGQLVFGAFGKSTKFGTLSQAIVISGSECAPLLDGVDPDCAAAVGIAGTTASRSLVPYGVKTGSKVFINGGSGGVGTFGIQIAKTLGAAVTTSCSTANVDLCRRLGADEVIDYKTTDIISELSKKGHFFDLVMDNVGSPELYGRSDSFLKPGGMFVHVGTPAIGIGNLTTTLFRGLWPGSRGYRFMMMKSETEFYDQIGKWMSEGKVRPIIDEVFEWPDVPKAFQKLRAGHLKGKIVVHVPPRDSTAG